MSIFQIKAISVGITTETNRQTHTQTTLYAMWTNNDKQFSHISDIKNYSDMSARCNSTVEDETLLTVALSAISSEYGS